MELGPEDCPRSSAEACKLDEDGKCVGTCAMALRSPKGHDYTDAGPFASLRVVEVVRAGIQGGLEIVW